MSKATLEFNIPEERQEHLQAVHVGGILSLIDAWERYLRNKVKHGNGEPVSWPEVVEAWYANKSDHDIPEEVFE